MNCCHPKEIPHPFSCKVEHVERVKVKGKKSKELPYGSALKVKTRNHVSAYF